MLSLEVTGILSQKHTLLTHDPKLSKHKDTVLTRTRAFFMSSLSNIFKVNSNVVAAFNLSYPLVANFIGRCVRN
jgi:hypothetical protein